MIAKEWQERKWVLLVAVIVAVLIVVVTAFSKGPGLDAFTLRFDPITNTTVGSGAIGYAWFTRPGTGTILIAIFAAWLGGQSLSRRVEGDMDFLLVQPISRTTIILAKTLTSALCLLIPVIAASLLLYAMHGYLHSGYFAWHLAISALYQWLWGVFVLLVATALSTFLPAAAAALIAVSLNFILIVGLSPQNLPWVHQFSWVWAGEVTPPAFYRVWDAASAVGVRTDRFFAQLLTLCAAIIGLALPTLIYFRRKSF